MTRKFEAIVILGATLETCSKHENYQRIDDLRSELLKQGLAFDGVDALTKDGKQQQKFLVVTEDVEGMLKLAKAFKQQNLIVSDSNRLTSLVDVLTGEKTELGELSRSTKDKVKQAEFSLLVTDYGAEYYYATLKNQ